MKHLRHTVISLKGMFAVEKACYLQLDVSCEVHVCPETGYWQNHHVSDKVPHRENSARHTASSS